MNKKLKKIIATVSAMVMCAVPMTAVEGNAYWVMHSQKQYQEEVDSLNNAAGCESRPDLCERFTKLIHWYDNDYWLNSTLENKVENVWVSRDDAFLPMYTIDSLLCDSLRMNIKFSETDNLTPEIIEQEISEITDISDGIKDFKVKKLEYSSEDDIFNPNIISIRINFSGDNHEENYKLCTDIVSKFKKYNITYASTTIEKHIIETRRLYLQSIDFGIITDDEINTINEDFRNHGFNVHLGKRDDLQKGDLKNNYYVIFDNPEEWTLEETLDVAVYCHETYDIPCNYYVETTGNINQDDSINLLTLAGGDANEDGEVSIADAVLIMQSMVNPDEYSLTPQGIANADMNGDGITTLDALSIQEMLVKK